MGTVGIHNRNTDNLLIAITNPLLPFSVYDSRALSPIDSVINQYTCTCMFNHYVTLCPVLRSAMAIKMKSRDQAHRQATIKVTGWQFAHAQAFPIVSNGVSQDKPQIKTVGQLSLLL